MTESARQTMADQEEPVQNSALTPREIVSELDRFIVGQNDAKRAVAIALRNRWRRQQLDAAMREEVNPKNILMIGPTGVGKTEIARRLAKLAQAPFLKVEATKFTEVGYVGRDVEQIIRDLVEIAIGMAKEKMRRQVRAKAEVLAEERVIDALVGEGAGQETRAKFRRMLRAGDLDAREIELSVKDGGGALPTFEIPGMPGASMGMINLNEVLGNAFGGRTKTRRMNVAESYNVLLAEESDKLLDQEKVTRAAIQAVEQNGIVFLDEIDKICARSERAGADVSREGVQRDLLPLIEGTTVATKHGPVKTDHVLFIASGAFHLAKPSDLLPELQGRLPIRVELDALTRADLRRILTEPEASLLKQYIALMQTESVDLVFTEDAVDALADLASEINGTVENIGARRLQTVLEKLLEEVSFGASEMGGKKVTIDGAYVRERVAPLARNTDLSKFIL
ncbi:ATP-dependent HslUV protease ATP-binding subunit HslU [Dongia mobilis]|uniref:ATP-dependent protease ATPase subunit HslU n=1 Tax=Dongia mobilis TaxID=578943 RepID=A0A4R6WSG0_9PROT|nr:ATP-dependent protease ATPase subunit HslU [Dongia mobilis]TDQ81994.1 ATP-dependent HslUV protease ATP-binding subunit HslU [Dongia mobilis]